MSEFVWVQGKYGSGSVEAKLSTGWFPLRLRLTGKGEERSLTETALCSTTLGWRGGDNGNKGDGEKGFQVTLHESQRRSHALRLRQGALHNHFFGSFGKQWILSRRPTWLTMVSRNSTPRMLFSYQHYHSYLHLKWSELPELDFRRQISVSNGIKTSNPNYLWFSLRAARQPQ